MLALPTYALAENPPESGFFDDYSRLQSAEADWVDYLYLSDGFSEKLAKTRILVIPQPELFLAPDSKYKGMKPDNMMALTDSMRQLLVDEFSDGYQIADSPGPNTLVLRMAFTNLHLKKKPRIPVVGWLPPAYIVTSAKRAVLDDFSKNILLTELVWEAEMTDSETGEIIGQILLKLGSHRDKKEFTSWDGLVVALAVAAKRMRCRFDNAPLPESQRRDCLEITVADIDFVE
jgi:hypothetical protein